jgi:tRNA modification GTPase
VIDTAGIRDTDDPVEQEGVRRARARAAEADLVLWLVDAQHEEHQHEVAVPVWVVRNKIDLDGEGLDAPMAYSSQGPGSASFAISASRGDGIPQLISALIVFAQDYFGSGETSLIGRERQRQLLQQTAVSLQRSLGVVREGEELAAEDLRSAVHSLGRLLGRVDVEDILDVIFREFCIGK